MDNTAMKTVIITGANSGLGFETAKNFAKDGWHIIMACRNKEKAEASRNEILRENSDCTVEVMTLDLSSLSSVREFAAEIEGRGLKIDALDCNAGIGSQLNTATEDGFDIVFKLCNVFFTYELKRRLRQAGSEITVNAFNPGMLLSTNLGGPRRLTAEQIKEREKEMSYWTGDIHKSASGVFTVLSDAAYADVSGKYFDRGTTIIPSSKLSYDEKIAAELWDRSIEVTGLKKDYLGEIL